MVSIIFVGIEAEVEVEVLGTHYGPVEKPRSLNFLLTLIVRTFFHPGKPRTEVPTRTYIRLLYDETRSGD